jgi:hypothetical protein
MRATAERQARAPPVSIRAPQLRVLLTQPLQLFTLVRAQQMTPAARVGLRLAHPHPQRLVVDWPSVEQSLGQSRAASTDSTSGFLARGRVDPAPCDRRARTRLTAAPAPKWNRRRPAVVWSDRGGLCSDDSAVSKEECECRLCDCPHGNLSKPDLGHVQPVEFVHAPARSAHRTKGDGRNCGASPMISESRAWIDLGLVPQKRA